MTDVERLGGESIRLHFDIGVGHLVHETGFTHVWITSHQESAGIGVDGRETR